MFQDVFLAFVPLFFAVDPIGLLPIFASLTGDLAPQERRKIAIQSLVTALFLAVAFIFFGKWTLALLGITIGDFMIAGGIILFCLSIIDLMSFEKKSAVSVKDLGAVPIGTPLVVGPAVLTLCLMLISIHGIAAVLIAVLLNLLIVAIVFLTSDRLIGVLGESGARVLSKVMALILASIGVMMVRKGILEIVSTLSNGS